MELNAIITVIKNACIQIKKAINNSHSSMLSKQTGINNSSGDETKELDNLTHNILIRFLSNNKNVYGIISEEDSYIHKTKHSSGSYIVAFDPLDGSSNIEFNITIGTIFAIYKLNDKKQITSGNSIVCSGYCLYGFKTEFIYTNPKTNCVEMLQLIDDKFITIKNNILIPNDKGKYYSVNHANSDSWQPKQLKGIIFNLAKSGYSQRYVGSMVADAHRVLLNGGLFLYPGDSKNKNGKIRLLYEAWPFAFLIKMAGGMTSNFEKNILDITMPDNIHQATPILIGNTNTVQYILNSLL